MSMIPRFQRLLDYERDAHRKTIESLRSVPEADRSGSEYGRAVSILAHMAAARCVWLYRLGALAERPRDLFPQEVDIDKVAADLHAAEQRWVKHLATLCDEDLSRVIEYQTTEGARFRNSLEEILTQLYGHSLYHRGQIAMLVKNAGGTPAATDFIYWARVPVL